MPPSPLEPPPPVPPLLPPLPPPFAPPPLMNGTGNGTGTNGTAVLLVDAITVGEVDYGAPIELPATGETYRWFSGNLTDLTSVWAAPLRIAINEIDFRGALSFLYYHQVVD